MTSEEIFKNFYDGDRLRQNQRRLENPFDADKLKGQKITQDLIDAKTGDVVAEAGKKMIPPVLKKIVGRGTTHLLVAEDELVGRYLAEDQVDESNGLVWAEAGEELTEALIDDLIGKGVKTFPTLDIDHVTVGAHIRNTLVTDKARNREEALIDIYRIMRPGEPPTLETAQALFHQLFFDAERYDLSAVGRVKMNCALALKLKIACGLYAVQIF